jgi:hypothetical protein
MRALQYGITCAFLISAAAACTRAPDRSVAPESPEPKNAGGGPVSVGVATLHAAEPTGETKAKAEAPLSPKAELPGDTPCPEGMALVEGEYCPDVEQKCLEWMDPPSSRYANFRCAHYAKPATCKSKTKEHRRYCIDVTERKEEGTDLPRHFMSWTSSKALCESQGARLCRESEWIFACEGEEMRPYPYGWDRDPTACNTDIFEGIGRPGALRDHRSAVGSHAKCASPFGVQDLAGNVEEWAQADGPGQGSKMGWKEVLKGSWWIPSRHACRQFQVGHNDVYNGAETGTRCCKDAPSKQ